MLKIEVKEDGSYELNLEGELVSVEEKEEFWIQDNQWVEAKDLEAGDLLQTDDGDFVTVDRVEVREGSFEVFNFEVEDFHTYFVSQNGVLVHNVNCLNAFDWNNRIKQRGIVNIDGNELPWRVPTKDTPFWIQPDPTHGLFNDFSGNLTRVRSGSSPLTKQFKTEFEQNGLLNKNIEIALKHAEGNVAAIMRRDNIQRGIITINHEEGPCPFCQKGLSKILKSGQRLDVIHSPDNGITNYVDTFIGGQTFNVKTDRQLLDF